MLVKEAKQITGGLSSPSKMPGYAYNLPAWECVTGVKLQAVAGSVCSGCYAMKGRYRFPNVKDALNRLDGPYDLVLMDPPYSDPFPMEVVEQFGSEALLAEYGQVVVGHPSRAEPPLRCGLMALAHDRRYGDSALAFYERITEELAL